jgi:hypothetical protein
MQWRPLLPKEGGLIQVDIGGHPPFPTGSKQFSSNFGNLLFLAVFTSGAVLMLAQVDPGFNATTMHQQNPNYRPFRQHL